MPRHDVLVRQAMTHPRDYLPILDRIGVALEATCDALITLQSIDVLPTAGEAADARGRVARAITHLQHAIEELRDARAQGHTGVALGFVLAPDRRDSGEDGRTDQSSPRRTA
jgi:hypothetical protein